MGVDATQASSLYFSVAATVHKAPEHQNMSHDALGRVGYLGCYSPVTCLLGKD